MKYMKMLSIKLLALSIVLIPTLLPAAPEGAREAAFAAADTELLHLLQVVPDSELPLLGFKDRQETHLAITGTPFMVYTISPDDVMRFNSGSAIGGMLEETGMWYVPVLVNNEYRALITVVPTGGKLTAIGISGAGLALELNEFQNLQGSTRVETLVPPKFIRIRQAVSDFMYLETGEGEYLRPFSSAQASLGVAPDTLLEPAKVMAQVKATVQKSTSK